MTEKLYLEEFLKEFPLTNYDWKLISHGIRSNIFKINKKNNNNSDNNDNNDEDSIYIKELLINDNNENNEIKISKYKQIFKEIYLFIKLKKYDYFSKEIEFKISKDKNYAHLITWGNTTSLKALIGDKKYNYLDDKELIKHIINQIAFGLYILHSNNIIHHDIKPSNILINNKEYISIIDFGSTIFKGEQTISFTLHYAAPELLLGYNKNVDEKVDMWGLGVIMLELYLKNNGIFHKEEIDKRVDQLNYISQNFYVKNSIEKNELNNEYKLQLDKKILDEIGDKDAIELLYNLLSYDPKKRFSAREVLLKSKYLKKCENKKYLKNKAIEYPKDYDKITNNINHDKFIELLEKINNN